MSIMILTEDTALLDKN